MYTAYTNAKKIQCVTNCMYVAIWPSMIAMLKTSITDVKMITTSSYHNDELKQCQND